MLVKNLKLYGSKIFHSPSFCRCSCLVSGGMIALSVNDAAPRYTVLDAPAEGRENLADAAAIRLCGRSPGCCVGMYEPLRASLVQAIETELSFGGFVPLGAAVAGGAMIAKEVAEAIAPKAATRIAPKGGATGNDLAGDFLWVRTGNPSINVDAEAGLNAVDPRNPRLFNALEPEAFNSPIATRNPQKMSDGSIAENYGYVYNRNDNGRVASQGPLSESGITLDFVSISTENARQSAMPRNQNEQLAFYSVNANPQGGPNGRKSRFTINTTQTPDALLI